MAKSHGQRSARPTFGVVLIPHTLEHTFPLRYNRTIVNIEVDILAKYVASLQGKPGVDGSGQR
ncbi:MAG: hypothetical protein R3A47_08195 [Polyangiales bacterium]